MAPSASAQRRTHSLLLLQRLLNLRDGASPFTLLIDTLEQSAQPVEEEFMARAKVRRTDTLVCLIILKLVYGILFGYSLIIYFLYAYFCQS